MCVLDHTGTIYCWGKDNAGQLGDGGTLQRTTPIRVDGLGGPTAALFSDNEVSYAFTRAGNVYRWGRVSLSTSSSSVIADLGSDVESIALGNWHVCAKKADGSLWCWHQGLAFDGDTPPVPSTTPAAIAELGTDVARVWTGYKSTCALRKDGTLWCWGTDLGLSVAPTQIAAGCN